MVARLDGCAMVLPSTAVSPRRVAPRHARAERSSATRPPVRSRRLIGASPSHLREITRSARESADALARTAVLEDNRANWELAVGEGLVGWDGLIRTQWCHGGPGVAEAASAYLDEDVLRAAGELVWEAGPPMQTSTSGLASSIWRRMNGRQIWLSCGVGVRLPGGRQGMMLAM